jgi:hypothetical protein
MGQIANGAIHIILFDGGLEPKSKVSMGPIRIFYRAEWYDFERLLRLLVTVNDPSSSADSLIEFP